MKKVRDAVSVVLSVKGELFFIKRKNELRAFPGYSAFVGGKVEDSDYEELSTLNTDIKELHLVNAVVRELEEELALKLTNDNVERIGYIAQATSPAFNPVRFATHFFQVELKEKYDFIIDQNEIASVEWSQAKDILADWGRGESLIVPPIRKILELLSTEIFIDEFVEFSARYDAEKEVPSLESISDLIQFMPLSNTLPPADRTNAFLIKGEENILLDPSPKDEKELEKFLYTIPKIDKIFLTHYHGDHYQFTREIALELSVPVFLHKFTKELIERRQGDDYFKGIKTFFVEDRDIIGTWQGENVRVYNIFGHAKGQIGFAPDNKAWFIAGDLFQGVGSVVVGGENASMKEYFKSLEFVIDFDPACVIPSHGIALGGTEIIQKNLKHRQLREEQVYKCFLENDDIESIYQKVYPGLDEKLKPYAVANIEAHLDKLREDGRLS